MPQSSRRRRILMIRVGDPAPDFVLKDHNKNEVSLSSLKGLKNSVRLLLASALTRCHLSTLGQENSALKKPNSCQTSGPTVPWQRHTASFAKKKDFQSVQTSSLMKIKMSRFLRSMRYPSYPISKR
jgi:hypothetical protein